MAELKDFHVVNGDLLVQGKVVADNVETRSGEHIETESAWEKSVKTHITQDDANEELKINEAVGIGDSSSVSHSTLLNVHGDAQVHGELMLDNLAHFQNTDGKQLLKIVSKADFEGEYVYETGIVYIVVDDADSTSQTYGQCYIRYFKPAQA